MIGARPAPLLPQSKLFISAACTFSTTCVFACVCTFRLAVVIRVRPAPSFDQYGLLASTACTFLRRLMFILFWYLLKPARLCSGRPLLGRLGCLLEAPGPPREARPPKALQGGGLGRLGLSLGKVSGPHLGGFPASCLGILKKPARLCGGRPILGRLGCLLEAPGPPREARPPKAPQRHSKEAVWVVWGCLLEISGPHLGGLPAPQRHPKVAPGTGPI